MPTSSTRTPSITPVIGGHPLSGGSSGPLRHSGAGIDEPLEAQLSVGQVEVPGGVGDVALEHLDLLREAVGGQVEREDVLVPPVGLTVDAARWVGGSVVHRGKLNSSRAFCSTIWWTSPSGTSRNCSDATLRLFG